MNNQERQLINNVCDGDIRKAQQAAQIVLASITTAKDESFKKHNLRKLESKSPALIELPMNLRDVLAAEDVTDFPTSRFLLRDKEQKFVDKILSVKKAADRLHELNIHYLPAAILYGDSGTGKTMLARYIAHRTDLPFVYIRFSGLISSYLGSTQNNLNRVFDYVRTNPCVLCFDEIDCVGMKRGQKDDVGEMNRIVISLMQELDQMQSQNIIIGTTNRFDRLDPALVRRFPIQERIEPLSYSDAQSLVYQFLDSAKMIQSEAIVKILGQNDDCPFAPFSMTAADVVNRCTQYVVDMIMADEADNIKPRDNTKGAE